MIGIVRRRTESGKVWDPDSQIGYTVWLFVIAAAPLGIFLDESDHPWPFATGSERA